MKHVSTITSVVLALLFLASCGNADPKAQLEKLKSERANLDAQIAELEKQLGDSALDNHVFKQVLVTTVAPGVFKHYIDVQGAVDAESNVAVNPQMPGVMTRIFVTEGQSVSTGQVLGEVDNSVLKAQLNALNPQLTMALDVYNRQKRLWEQKVGSEMQFLQAKTGKEAIEKQIAALEEQIEMTQIKSPLSGVVDHIGGRVGQYAAPGMPDPAFRVINNSKMKVKAEFAESYASMVKKGDAVDLNFPDLGVTSSSTATFVAKFINPMTRTFTVESKIAGDLSGYQPNMVAIMKVVDYQNEQAITLPINTLLNSGTESYVYVVKQENNKKVARKKVVTIGKTYNGVAEITGGLTAGDQVITTGQFEIADGSEVQF
jgi:membrane fusion protein (multidrug efflux system)